MSIIRTIKLIARHPIASIKDYRMFGDVDAFRAINKEMARYMGGYEDPNVKYEGPLFEAHVKETIKEWKKMGYDDEHITYNMDTVITEAKMTYGTKYQYEELKKINNPIIRREVNELMEASAKAFGEEYRSLYDKRTNTAKNIKQTYRNYVSGLKYRLPEPLFEAWVERNIKSLDDSFDIDPDTGRRSPSYKEMVRNSYIETYKGEKFQREARKLAKKAGGEFVAEDGSKLKILPDGGLSVTVDDVKKFVEMRNNPKEYFNKMKVATAAVVATQAPATKEYNDASSSSFKSKKSVYDSIPSTRSAGVGSRVSSPETFKNGVVNMARTMDASAGQISKLLKMDAKLLEELYYDKPFLFDLYFEYSLYDDFGASHEDSGINKLIESYEYKFGVTL